MTAEEGVARLADFRLIAPAGALDLNAFLGVAVTIVMNGTTVFTGVVDEAPTIDEVAGTLAFACSDAFQDYWEAKSLEQTLVALAAAAPRWDEGVFGRREDGWQQFQDIAGTIPYGVHLDGAGTLRVIAWAGSGADYAYTEADIDAGSLKVWTAQRRELHNTVDLEVKVRYTRRHHRSHAWSWSYAADNPWTWCNWFLNSYTLPTRETISSAANGTGWAIVAGTGWSSGESGIHYKGHPVTGSYTCYNPDPFEVGWIVDEAARAETVLEATWKGVRRWTQTITETYALRVQASASRDQWGELKVEDAAGYASDYDDAAWDGSAGTDVPADLQGFYTDTLGDRVSDELVRALADNLIETLLAVAATGIRRTHRLNGASWRADLTPGLDLRHRASVDTTRPILVDGASVTLAIQAEGKVARLRHVVEFESGNHYTEIEIACSRQGGTGGSADPLTAPDPPSTAPTHLAPDNSTSLPTHVGSKDWVPDYDPDWEGWAGNYQEPWTPDPGEEAKVYPNAFRVVGPDIEIEARDELLATRTQTFEIEIPDDPYSVRLR